MIKKICGGALFVIVALTLVLGLDFFGSKSVAYAEPATNADIVFFDHGEEVYVLSDVGVGTTLKDQMVEIKTVASLIAEDSIPDYAPGTGPEEGLINGENYNHKPPEWYFGDRLFDEDTVISNEMVNGGEIRVDSRYFFNEYYLTIIYDDGKESRQLRKIVTYGGTVEITSPPGGLVFGQYLSYDSEQIQDIKEPKIITVYIKTFVWYLLGALLLAAFVAGVVVLLMTRREEKLIKRDEILRKRLLIEAANQDARISKMQSKRFKREEEAAQKLKEEAEAKRKATEETDGFLKI